MDTCKDYHNNCDESSKDCKDRKNVWKVTIGGNHPGVLENHPSFKQMFICAEGNPVDSDACKVDSGGKITHLLLICSNVIA